MKRELVIAVSGYFFLWANCSSAYEPGTHGQMADDAAQKSVLVKPFAGKTTTVLRDLGLSAYADAQ